MTSIIYGAVCGGHHDSRHRREVEDQVARHGRSMEDHPRPRASTTASTATARRHAGGRRGTRPTSALASGDRSQLARAPTSGARPPRATRKWRSGARPPARSTRRRSSSSRAWTRCPWRTSTPTSARRRTSSLRSTIRPRPPAARWPGCAGCSGSSSGARSSTRATSRSTGCRSASRTGSYPSRREAHQGAQAPGAHPRPGLFSLITAVRMSNTRDLTGAKIDLEDAFACVPSSHYLYPKPGLTDCVRTWPW